MKGIRFQLLAGSIATIVAWSALWNKMLGDEGIAGNFGVYRGLLGILAILLLAGAPVPVAQGDDARVDRDRRPTTAATRACGRPRS